MNRSSQKNVWTRENYCKMFAFRKTSQQWQFFWKLRPSLPNTLKKKKVFNHYNRNGFQILHIISFLHTVTQWIKNIPPDTIKVWINWRNKYIFWNVMQLSSNTIEIEMFLYFSLYVDVLDRCRYFKEFTCLRILSLQTNHLSLFLFKCMF